MNLVCEPHAFVQHPTFQTIKIKRSKKLPKRILKRIKSRKLREKRETMRSNYEVSTISDEDYDMLFDIEL